jgi:4-hydroxy-tetrahydrodipicolinate reductase
MKIGIIGYGKMGHAVESMARAQGMEVASLIDPTEPGATHRSIAAESLRDVDVAIDFSSPKAVLDNIDRVTALGKAMVVGTTAWYDGMERAKSAVAKGGAGFVYSPNFSIGVNLFFKMADRATTLINRFPMYDPYVYEIHHRQKTDAPGGTAKILGGLVTKNIERKKRMAFDRINERKIDPDEVQVGSIRAGYVPGTHVLGFDGEADTIELIHTARSRTGFAEGALLAAKWINGRKGFYTLEDVLSDMIGE